MIKVIIKDILKIKNKVYNTDTHIRCCLSWLAYAQSQSLDGGVPAWYRIDKGWADSFIETTGYIISTFLEGSKYFNDQSYLDKATIMADFILDMQLSNGGFKTRVAEISEPTIFNTAQDLRGMCDIYSVTRKSKYYNSAKKAADFLVSSQDKNGQWIKYSYDGLTHSYDSKVAYALLKFYKISNNTRYKKAATRALDGIVKLQLKNGWFKKAELPGFKYPLTHTIAYTIEGLLDSGTLLGNKKYLASATKSATALLVYYKNHGFMPASFDSIWHSSDSYSCLSGNAQISIIWLKLFLLSNKNEYLISASDMNKDLKETQDCYSANKSIFGGIKGSNPIYGNILKNQGYCRFAYINWAAKYFSDALILESLVRKGKQTKYV